MGAGFGGKVHLPAWRSIPDARVVAVADSGSGRAAQLTGDHIACRSWCELMERADIDLLDVVVPPADQKEIVVAALRARRHVVCAKPFGARLADARAMEAEVPADIVCAIGYQFRYELAWQRMRELIAGGQIGRVLRIDVRWITGNRLNPSGSWNFQHDDQAGGGVGNAFLSHVIDYVRWLSGENLCVDGGRKAILVPFRTDVAGRRYEVTAEDSADLLAATEGGAAVSVTISNCLPNGAGHSVDVYGVHGRLSFRHAPPFRPDDAKLSLHGAGISQSQMLGSIPDVEVNGDSRLPALRKLLIATCRRIRGEKTEDLPSVSDGVRVHEALEAWRSLADFPRL